MGNPTGLWIELCSYENLELAYKKARKHKTKKEYVIEFERNLQENLSLLRIELLLHSYTPESLKTFIVRDPKTRKISKSAFRDRVVHHALCNIIEPIFEKQFIYDSYANRINKGTLKALQRFDYFKRKISVNGAKINNSYYTNMVVGYVLKADIRHYFDAIDHEILIKAVRRTIRDENIIWLVGEILKQHCVIKGKGMPLGNLTSQFFANLYLNDFDYFVKHKLKAKYYIRYVDDFVILHNSKSLLIEYKDKIEKYLTNLKLEIHPDKSKIIPIYRGVKLLGFRIFYHRKLIKKSNFKRFKRKLCQKTIKLAVGDLNHVDFANELQGWFGYAMWADTYKLRGKIMKEIEKLKQ